MHANLPEIAKRWERDYANGGITRIPLGAGGFPNFFQMTPENIATARNTSWPSAIKQDWSAGWRRNPTNVAQGSRVGLGSYINQGINSLRGKFNPGSNVGGATNLMRKVALGAKNVLPRVLSKAVLPLELLRATPANADEANMTIEDFEALANASKTGVLGDEGITLDEFMKERIQERLRKTPRGSWPGPYNQQEDWKEGSLANAENLYASLPGDTMNDASIEGWEKEENDRKMRTKIIEQQIAFENQFGRGSWKDRHAIAKRAMTQPRLDTQWESLDPDFDELPEVLQDLMGGETFRATTKWIDPYGPYKYTPEEDEEDEEDNVPLRFKDAKTLADYFNPRQRALRQSNRYWNRGDARTGPQKWMGNIMSGIRTLGQGVSNFAGNLRQGHTTQAGYNAARNSRIAQNRVLMRSNPRSIENLRINYARMGLNKDQIKQKVQNFQNVTNQISNQNAGNQQTSGDHHSGNQSTVDGQTTDWGDMSYMIAGGGLAQRAPRGSYFNGGLASIWPR